MRAILQFILFVVMLTAGDLSAQQLAHPRYVGSQSWRIPDFSA